MTTLAHEFGSPRKLVAPPYLLVTNPAAVVLGAAAPLLPVCTLSRVVPARVKYMLVPSYSTAPVSAVVRFVPAVNLSGALVVPLAPAAMCT